LRCLEKNLFVKYLESLSIVKPLPQPKKDEDEWDCWERFIGSLGPEEANRIESGLQDVNELSDDGGIAALLELAEIERIRLQNDFEGIENEYNKALFCYLNYREVFESASILYHVSDLKTKSERTGFKKVVASLVQKHGESLAKALSEYFLSKDGRGRRCHVDVYKYEERVCFVAYPEDYLKSDIRFNDKGKFERSKRRSCLEIVYVYYPGEGRLQLSGGIGYKKEKELLKIFNEVVLGDDSPIDDSQKIYDLDKLLGEDFTFVIDSEDEVEHAGLKQLRVRYKRGRDKFTLEVAEADGVTTMHEAMKYRNINAENFTVLQATIHMKFPGKGKRGSVTIILSMPNKCNLNESTNHQKAKKYLKLWGLENRLDIKKTPQVSSSL